MISNMRKKRAAKTEPRETRIKLVDVPNSEIIYTSHDAVSQEPPTIIQWKQPEKKSVDVEMLVLGIFIGIALSVLTMLAAMYL